MPLFFESRLLLSNGEKFTTIAQFVSEKDASAALKLFAERDADEGREYMIQPVEENPPDFKFDLVFIYDNPDVVEKGNELWLTAAQFLFENDAINALKLFAERDANEGLKYYIRPVKENLS